jgi:prepilin-type N-terminal cleavage/methylation domain-containing protein
MKQSGFTLIELSVVIAIIGVILYGGMSVLVVGIQTSQVNATVARMDKIEKALLDYRVANGRIPCPSDLTATASSANYGVEAANKGSCTGGSPAANSISASGVAEGGIPVRALRLPNDYMYDGWGHRFRYAVNPDYTVTYGTACTLNANPSITVNDASGAARSNAAIYAIVSHGQNGHGAYTRGGGVVNAGSTNADEQTNCHCTSTAAANTYTATYVEKAPTIATAGSPLTTFDDIVTFREAWQMMSPELSANSWGCGFYARSITINASYVSTVNKTNLTNFPVLFSGTYSYLATQANGGNATNANGYDITFTSDPAGKNLLPFERESYNATTGAVAFWVQVPTVYANNNSVIYLQYSNPTITTDQSNKTGTWDSNYQSVWHLKETPTGTAPHDSTSNANTATYQGTWAAGNQIAGEIDGSLNFDGSTDFLSTANQFSPLPTTVTEEIWFKTTSTNGGKLIGFGNSQTGQGATSYGEHIYMDTSGKLYWGVWILSGGATLVSTGSSYNDGNWHSAVGVLSNTGMQFFIDGNSVGTNASGTSSNVQSYNAWIRIGEDLLTHWPNSPSNFYFGGQLDEVRVSNTARSADWIVTEYNSQSAPGTFYTVGSAFAAR